MEFKIDNFLIFITFIYYNLAILMKYYIFYKIL